MGCKYKKHNYSKIDIGYDNGGNSLNIKGLAKEGNKSINGLIKKMHGPTRR